MPPPKKVGNEPMSHEHHSVDIAPTTGEATSDALEHFKWSGGDEVEPGGTTAQPKRNAPPSLYSTPIP